MAKTKEDAAASDEQPPKPKSAIKKIAMLALLLLVVGGAGAGAAWFMMGEPAAAAGSTAPRQPAKTVSYFNFPDAFMSNIDSSPRLVQLHIGLATEREPAFFDRLQQHETPVRAALLAVLMDAPLERLTTSEGKDELREEMRRAADEELEQRTGESGISEVFFTDMVIQ